MPRRITVRQPSGRTLVLTVSGPVAVATAPASFSGQDDATDDHWEAVAAEYDEVLPDDCWQLDRSAVPVVGPSAFARLITFASRGGKAKGKIKVAKPKVTKAGVARKPWDPAKHPRVNGRFAVKAGKETAPKQRVDRTTGKKAAKATFPARSRRANGRGTKASRKKLADQIRAARKGVHDAYGGIPKGKVERKAFAAKVKGAKAPLLGRVRELRSSRSTAKRIGWELKSKGTGAAKAVVSKVAASKPAAKVTAKPNEVAAKVATKVPAKSVAKPQKEPAIVAQGRKLGLIRDDEVQSAADRYRSIAADPDAKSIDRYYDDTFQKLNQWEYAALHRSLGLPGTPTGKITDLQAVRDSLKATNAAKPVDKSGGLRERLRREAHTEADRLFIVRDHIRENQSEATTKVRAHGMTDAEDMHSVTIDGITIRYRGAVGDDAIHPAISTATHILSANIPKDLSRHTHTVILSKQKSADDAMWEKRYGIKDLVSGATGGDGKIVVYNGIGGTPSMLAHEMGHNHATAVYGTTNPRQDGDYSKAASSGERPVSDYATKSPGEDYAEAWAWYATRRDEFKKSHPKRFAVIDRLATDRSYNG